jgi:hypothetical protein
MPANDEPRRHVHVLIHIQGVCLLSEVILSNGSPGFCFFISLFTGLPLSLGFAHEVTQHSLFFFGWRGSDLPQATLLYLFISCAFPSLFKVPFV